MNLNERNYAGDHVVVGSLEVLGSVKGGGITEIRRNVDMVQQQAEQIARKQNAFWETLSADGVISPVEKQMLLKEFKSIQNSYGAIHAQAASLDLDNTQLFLDYKATYEDLQSYLYISLKLFDDMNASTDINDRDEFNAYFTRYYYDENFIMLALSKGILASVDIRILESLDESGDEEEVAIYRGGLYQYVNGEWTNVLTGLYRGALEAAPVAPRENEFFLSSKDYVEAFYINGEPLYINGEQFGIKLYQKGWIYYYEDGKWHTDYDRNSHRYYEAMTDVIYITGELPEIFKTEIAKMNTGNLYKGRQLVAPQNPQPGEWFVYAGSTTGDWHKSSVYRYEDGDWEELSPTLSQYRQYYMTALEDILYLNETNNGYFAAIFSQSLFANDATINSLATKTIYLREGGYIQSDIEEYEPQTTGLLIDSAGNIDANGDTHIAGKVAIGVNLKDSNNNYESDFENYDVVIGGHTKIGGNVDFTGSINTQKECIAAGFELAGLQPGNELLIRMNATNGTVRWQTPASGTIRIKGNQKGQETVYPSLYIYINETLIYSWNTEIFIGFERMEATGIDIDVNVEINVGDIISIRSGAGPEGVSPRAVVTSSHTFNGGLYTATRNSLVTFLGRTITENSPAVLSR